MPHTFVKICGITTTDAAETVAEAGADAIGFVFAPGSVRAVSADQATSLVAAVAGQLETVGVFRNQPIDEVLRTASLAGLTTVQLHGDEPDSDIDVLRSAGFRTIRAVSIDAYRALRSREESGTTGRAAAETDPTRLLIDAVSPGGGTLFDTSELETTPPDGFWILAGGLTPDNVGALVSGVRPGGVDVSSGVESSRGVKDLALIRDFVQAVR